MSDDVAGDEEKITVNMKEGTVTITSSGNHRRIQKPIFGQDAFSTALRYMKPWRALFIVPTVEGLRGKSFVVRRRP